MVKNLAEVVSKFQDEQVCRDYLVQQRWNGVPTCPYCGSQKSYKIENGKRFKCGNKECYKKYSVTVGTIFESSNIPLSKWFIATYIITAHKKGISSIQLGKDIGVTQKTAWFMLSRLREVLKAECPTMLTGVVELDETYLAKRYRSEFQGLSEAEIDEAMKWGKRGKGVVMGAMQRGGDVILTATKEISAKQIGENTHKHVSQEASLMTDQARWYRKELADYSRQSVDHSIKEWSRGDVHTNNIEAVWSLMKRGISGIYHQISAKHLQLYCNEFSYRYNSRKVKDGFRFQLALLNVEGRLTYKLLYMAKKTAPKKKTPKEPKPRANKYEEKLQINASFEEVMNVLANPKASHKDK